MLLYYQFCNLRGRNWLFCPKSCRKTEVGKSKQTWDTTQFRSPFLCCSILTVSGSCVTLPVKWGNQFPCAVLAVRKFSGDICFSRTSTYWFLFSLVRSCLYLLLFDLSSNIWTPSKPPCRLLISNPNILFIPFSYHLNPLVSRFLTILTAILWTYSQCPVTLLTSNDLKIILKVIVHQPNA